MLTELMHIPKLGGVFVRYKDLLQLSPKGSSIGCKPCFMKRRFISSNPPSPYCCVDMSKKKKKDLLQLNCLNCTEKEVV
jgi:hypothetical protein